MCKNLNLKLLVVLLFAGNANAAQSTKNVDKMDVNVHEAKQSAQADAKKTGFDFMNADAPFSYGFNIGEHKANIQLFGIIDVALTKTNHSLTPNYELPNNVYSYSGAPINNATKARGKLVNGGLQDSRLGIRGDVGLFNLNDNPFKLVYAFEAGFNPIDMKLNNAAQTLADNSGTKGNSSLSADSSLNGELFSRQAWAGVDAGKLGRVSYGTQYNPFFEMLAAYDPNGKADTFSPLGESGTVGGGAGISENARMKNSIKYANMLNATEHGKVNYGVMYQNGNAAGTAHGHGITAQAGYEESNFGIQFAYDRFADSVKAGTAGAGNPLANNTISATLFNTDSTLVTLKWLPRKDLRISGGWEWYQLKPSSDQTLNYSNLFDQTVFRGVATSGLKPGYKQDNNIYFVGASFDFDNVAPALAGLTTSIGFYETKFDAIKGPTISTNSQGNIGTWTFIADYKINKRFDTYAAYTNNHFSGDKFPSATTYTNVSTLGTGLRMRF